MTSPTHLLFQHALPRDIHAGPCPPIPPVLEITSKKTQRFMSAILVPQGQPLSKKKNLTFHEPGLAVKFPSASSPRKHQVGPGGGGGRLKNGEEYTHQ